MAQRQGARRAVLLPLDVVRGHFAVAPDEIIQHPTRPPICWTAAERAAMNLRRIMDARLNMARQVNLFEVAAEQSFARAANGRQ